MAKQIDLLSPETYRENYVSQLRETIRAYSVPLVTVGEALQNAMDAIEHGQPQPDEGRISVHINFDAEEVTVCDNGAGFPNQPRLLFLGGGCKGQAKQRGRVGVGIKVTLFSSRTFVIQSCTDSEQWRIDIQDAYKFEELPSLRVPATFPADPSPLSSCGTSVKYTFPDDLPPADRMLTHFLTEVVDASLPKGFKTGFAKHITDGNHKYPSQIAAILACYLRRYSYLADVLNTMQDLKKTTFPPKGIKVSLRISCSDPSSRFRPEIAALFNSQTDQEFTIVPAYLLASESGSWSKKAPSIFGDRLGKGGVNLERTDGLNVLFFRPSKDYQEFEQLVTDRRGNLPEEIDEFRTYLFPKINGIALTIARIPDFDTLLPGGSARIISANGVPTGHELDFVSGRNQEYVRCFDLVVDVDAGLNYGKTHLTDLHLVNRLRRFLNESYARVIQNAAGKWVGRLPSEEEDEDEEHFVGRARLPLQDMVFINEPHSEHDVIALYFELAGRGFWPDYRFYGLSSKTRYDGKAAIKRPSDRPGVLDPKDDTKLRSVEFKWHATEVIRDFERKQKWTSEIALVIAWDEGDYTSQQYKLYDIEHSKAFAAKPSKVFPRAQKYIYDAREGREVQVLLLEPVVQDIASAPAEK